MIIRKAKKDTKEMGISDNIQKSGQVSDWSGNSLVWVVLTASR